MVLTEPPKPSIPLQRALGFWPLVFYGLGTIVGAGIYVLLGAVAGRAGMAAPAAFLLAGAVAAVTGLSYAELVARHPEAAGEVAYVKAAFGSDLLARVVGIGLVLVAIVAGASIARGSAGYVQQYVDVPAWLAAGSVVVLFTVVALIGVSESVRVAVLMTLIELAGLVVVVVAGAPQLAGAPAHLDALIPLDGATLGAALAGTFLAFFAFIGFDTMVNMAEETRDVGRTLPRAILAAIALSTLLYVAVSLVAVHAVPPAELAAGPAPLVSVLERSGWPLARHFAAVVLIATSNGVLIEIILVARLCYGMARRGLLPHGLAWVHGRTRTPVPATLLAGGAVLLLVVAVPFEMLVAATSTITLLIFSVVNLALWRLHRVAPRHDLRIAAPPWAPPLGALSCLGLIGASLLF